MWHLGRTWRKTNETRKRYERSRWEVQGGCNPHSRCFRHKQTNRTLQIIKTRSSKEAKLVRFLCQLIRQHRCFTVIMQEQETNKFVIQASWSVHCQRNESDWVRAIQINVPVSRIFILTTSFRAPSGSGTPSECPVFVSWPIGCKCEHPNLIWFIE